MSPARELSLSERVRPRASAAPSAPPPTTGLGETVLRAGLVLGAVVAATNGLFAVLAGAGAHAAAQGLVLVAIAVAGFLRTDVVVRVMRPQYRVLLPVALFSVAGAFDSGFHDHFGGVAGAIVCMAAFICSARWVAVCVVVCAAGYLGGLALHGNSLEWMLGDGRYIIAGHLVNFAGNGAVGLLVVRLLRRFLVGVPQRLAAVRAGGPSLTPQLALAACGQPLATALLPAADARTLIAPLTSAERDVVALLAAGRVPKQVAGDLSIAMATVRSRLASAKRKTGARTLDQLVAMYTEAERAV